MIGIADKPCYSFFQLVEIATLDQQIFNADDFFPTRAIIVTVVSNVVMVERKNRQADAHSFHQEDATTHRVGINDEVRCSEMGQVISCPREETDFSAYFGCENGIQKRHLVLADSQDDAVQAGQLR